VQLNESSWGSDVAVAALVAKVAGIRLQLVRGRTRGLTADQRKRIGDEEAQRSIAGALRRARPDDGVLSEEAVDDHTRLERRRVWIVDPLDGTREYAEGRSDWAVHVALWEEGALVAAAVALPALGRVLTTSPAPVVPAQQRPRLQLVVSRTRPPDVARAVATSLPADVVASGSAGYKIAAVIRGDADVYVHAGGQWEWDSAAPVAVAQAAGLHASRIDGSPLRYNQPHPWQPDLVVCRPELAERVLQITASYDAAVRA
jgi:3'(2'), 5'-bisphosphate nucleotidase